MPSGIILSSGSQGATQEAIEKVLTEHGYEPDKAEAVATETVEEAPKRDAFDTDEAFDQAKEKFEAKQEEAAEAVEAEAERKENERLAALPKASRRQRAIDKATKKLQDDLRNANERIAALEGKKPEAAAAKEPAKPKLEDFKTDEEYDEAMFEWRYKMRRAKEQVEESRKALHDRLKENFESYQAQVAEFKDEHDDWDDVVNQSIPIHESVYLAVQEQENGAQVTYYLGKHPDYARKLADMTPLSAVMEVGRLAERLKTGAATRAEAGSGDQKKPKPKLPEPVKPVSTSATASSLTSSEAAKARDFKAFKRAQAQGR